VPDVLPFHAFKSRAIPNLPVKEFPTLVTQGAPTLICQSSFSAPKKKKKNEGQTASTIRQGI